MTEGTVTLDKRTFDEMPYATLLKNLNYVDARLPDYAELLAWTNARSTVRTLGEDQWGLRSRDGGVRPG
jgi:hypothetical protein